MTQYLELYALRSLYQLESFEMSFTIHVIGQVEDSVTVGHVDPDSVTESQSDNTPVQAEGA